MLSLGWSEISIIVFIVIIVVGPKELPTLIKQVGFFSKKIKSISREFNTSLNNLAKEAEIDKIQNEVKNINSSDIKTKIIEESNVKKEFDDINTSFKKINKDIKDIEKDTKLKNE
tara:strand:- start:104 stop:448 length:345 start_codon:yes stop_codon:yes gene_type:complete